MACAGNDHEELVVLFAGGYGEFLVGVAAEIERVGFLSVENHDGVLYFSGTAHVINSMKCDGILSSVSPIGRKKRKSSVVKKKEE